jgi:hypothetical protein
MVETLSQYHFKETRIGDTKLEKPLSGSTKIDKSSADVDGCRLGMGGVRERYKMSTTRDVMGRRGARGGEGNRSPPV